MKRKYDPRVEYDARKIAYHIQTNESIHLSDKSMHDIFFTTRAVADYWKEQLDRELEHKFALKYNELRLWIMRNQPQNIEALEAIRKIHSGQSVR
jgi:hypothetical protein